MPSKEGLIEFHGSFTLRPLLSTHRTSFYFQLPVNDSVLWLLMLQTFQSRITSQLEQQKKDSSYTPCVSVSLCEKCTEILLFPI